MSSSWKPEELRVIIPVGGEARRLRPLTVEVSKACIRLANRPLIEIAILCLARQGVRNFIFGVKGYMNYRSLHDYFKEGIGFSARYGITPRVHFKYQPNEEDLGSADSARINMEYYDIRDPVFAVQGDNIFDIDLKEFMAFHEGKGALMTIGLRPVRDVRGYGVADVDTDMRIRRFVEKPREGEAPSNLVNTGLYLFTPEIRQILQEGEIQDAISERERLDFGYDLIPYLIRTGRPVCGYILKGSWYDVGTPERYLEATHDILHGSLSCLKDLGGRISEDENVWIQGESRESIKRREAIVKKVRDGRIKLGGAVLIGRHCQIGEGVEISDSCIDNFTKVAANVIIEGSAVMDRVVVGEGAEIRESIVGRHASIHSNLNQRTEVASLSVVGDDVTIEAGCKLRGTKVYPHLYVPRKTYVETTIEPKANLSFQ